MKLILALILPLTLLAAPQFIQPGNHIQLMLKSGNLTSDKGVLAEYQNNSGSIHRLDKNATYLLFMVESARDSITLNQLKFSKYRDLKTDIEKSGLYGHYEILPAKYYLGKRYFPLRVFPLEKNKSVLRVASEISFSINRIAQRNKRTAAHKSFKNNDIFNRITDWWKFNIDQSHIYTIEKSDASGWGMDVQNPEDLHFFSFNGAMLPYRTNTNFPEEMPEIPVYISNFSASDGWQNEEKVYVYVRGTDFFQYDSLLNIFNYHHHFYDQTNVLWLANDPSYQAPVIEATTVSNPTLTTQTAEIWQHLEKDEVNRLKSGTTWFENARNVSNNPFIIHLDIDNGLIAWDSNPQLTINLSLAGGNRYLWADRVGFRQYFDVDLENAGILNRLISSHYVSDNAFAKIALQYPLDSALTDPAIHINYNPQPRAIDGSASIEQGKYFFDYYELNYPADLTAIRTQEPLYLDFAEQTIALDFALTDKNTTLWNVTEAYSPGITILSAQNRFNPEFKSNKKNTYILSTPENVEKLPGPQQISYAFHLRNPATKSDMIIITPDEFYEKAVEYGLTREEWSVTPFKTEVVTVEDIYREFSAGVKDPAAIRNFLKYCWDYRIQKPSFALLIGDGNYDPKGIVFTGANRDFIPTFQIDSPIETGSFTTDFYYADLHVTSNSYNNIEPEIPLGRLPVSSNTQIDHYIEKLQNYGQQEKSNGWEEDILLIADDLKAGSSTYETFHFEGAENIYGNIPDRFNVFKLYLEQYPAISGGIGRIKPAATAEFLSRVNQGQAIVVYIGHGAPDKWAHETLYDLKLHRNQIANNFTNGLWMALSCDISKYDDPGRETMGEDLILRKASGAMWVFASTRLVLAYQNNELGVKIVRWLLGQSIKYTVGEALTLAVQDFSVSNTLKYVLFGDPSLPMLDGRIPVTFDNVHNLDTLKSLQKVTVTGSIGDFAQSYPDFKGGAVIRVYDTEDTLTHPNRFGGQSDYYTLGPGLYKGQLTVDNGAFSARFIVPKSIKYSSSPRGKIWFYALDTETGQIATTTKNNVVFYGSSGNIEDFSGPEISIAIDKTNLGVEGDLVGKDAELNIQLTDSSGINVSGEAGHEIALWVDDKEKRNLTDFFVYEENSAVSGELSYPLSTLDAGKHDFLIKAWDNANNPNEYRFQIEIVEAGEIVLENVLNYPNPMEDETWFTCQTTADNGRIEVQIFTLSGRKLKTLKKEIENLDFQRLYWDGRDANGNKLANGSYLYRFKLITPSVTKTVLEKLVILN